MQYRKYDVVIVGTGAAGLFAALSLSSDYDVLMITKDKLDMSDSYLAQGGISALLDSEDYEDYYEDTMKAGRYENNPMSVEVMIRSSGKIIKELIDYGVEFDKDENGNISYTREGGHSRYRILHHQDVTGKEIVTKLLKRVKERTNITTLEYTTMVDLISRDNRCCGIVTRSNDNKIIPYYAKSVILATGGLGGIFRNSTNYRHITGDGFAIALRHRIDIENLNYIQIHPTVLYSGKEGRKFLISESVRGEGAVLLNEDGQQFVDSLLPRDVVTQAIQKEMYKYGTDHVYLSFAYIDKEEIMSHFPHIYKRCLEEGYDVTKEWIPVTPAQHYLMGGIKTGTEGRTSMEQLYAVGETACNGVHGANRLASNSLLESLVFAENAAHEINQTIKDAVTFLIEVDENPYLNAEIWNEENRNIVWQYIKRKDRKFYDKWCDNESKR